MPLYYLHIRTRGKLEVDPDGIEVPDLGAARAEARRVARELVEEVPDLGPDAVIEITNEAGQVVQSVRISDAPQPKR
jgi:hypothetical protein